MQHKILPLGILRAQLHSIQSITVCFTQVYGYYTAIDGLLLYISALILPACQTKPRKNKVLTYLSRRTLYAAAVSGFLCGLPPAAFALNIQDFHTNCDIRQLNLSREQYDELRTLRGEYKQAAERLVQDNRRSERSRRDNLLRILSAPQFDERQAHRYVAERYEGGLQFAVDEMAVQHKFYQLLNPVQQRLWIQKCLQ